MTDRRALIAFLVGAALLTAVTTALAVGNILVAVGVAGMLGVLFVARRLDGWQRLLAVTMLLLICASSNVPSLKTLAFYPRYVAVAALVAWAFWASGRTGGPLDRWTRLFVTALWTVAGLATLSSVWSVVPGYTLAQSMALVLLAALAHVLVTRRWTDRTVVAQDLGVVYVMFSLSIVVSLAYGLAGSTQVAYQDRFQGFYANPNMVGLVCALTIPLGWALYRRSHRRMLLLGVVPAAVALVLSESRTSLVAVLAGGCWIVLRHGPRAVARLAAVLAAALVTGYVFNLISVVTGLSQVQAFAARFTDPVGDDFTSGRTHTWQATLDLWQSRPALGYGYASGFQLFEQTRQEEFFDVGVNLVHNSYLQWLLELGVAGVAPLLLCLVAALWAALRASMDQQVNPGLVWLIVTGLVIQVTESTMFGMGQPYPYVFWLAVAAVLLHSGRPGPAGRAAGPAARGRRPSWADRPDLPAGLRRPVGTPSGPAERGRISALR